MSSSNRSSSQKNLLSPTELSARSKALDEREAYVDSREATLKKVEHEILVLTETVSIKERQLSRIKEDTSQVQKVAQDKYHYLKARTADEQRQLRSLRDQHHPIREEISQSKGALVAAEKELASINKDISERSHYRKEQEKTINGLVEEGNTSLKAVAYEVEALIEDKAAVNRELRELNKDKIVLVGDIQSLQAALDDLDVEHAKRLNEYELTLEGQATAIAKAKEKLRATTEAVDLKLKTLAAKEESILAKQAALHREHEELTTEKRRFDSRRSLYDDIV